MSSKTQQSTAGRIAKDSLPPAGKVVMVKVKPEDTEGAMLSSEIHKFVSIYGDSPAGTWRVPSEVELQSYYERRRALSRSTP